MITRAATRERGQIVVVFAVALVAIALSVGLVVDGGMAFLQRREGQNDADLAALAGTKVIADAWINQDGTPRSAVYQAIQQRLSQSGCTGSSAARCTWKAHLIGSGQADLGELTAGSGGAVDGSNILGVRVDVTRRPQTFFLGLVGQGAWQVVTSATAMTARPTSAPAGQLLPIALRAPDPDNPFTKGQVYDLTPDRIAPGGFAWITWGSSGHSSVASSVCNPDNAAFRLEGGGTSFQRASTGTDWNAVQGCLEKWKKSGATVLIPLYDGDRSNPPSYRLNGVAAFVIKALDTPEDGDIRAYFVGTFAYAGVPADASQPPDPHSSMYYLGLVK